MKRVKRKPKKRRDKRKSIAILLCSVTCLTLSLANIVPYMLGEMQSAALKGELQALYRSPGGTSGAEQSGNQFASVTECDIEYGAGGNGTSSPSRSFSDEGDAPKSYDTTGESQSGIARLLQENPDCIAWITIKGTAIDYPVMYRPECKDYYLYRDFHGRSSASGCLYLSEICEPESSDNLIIYGHHMSNGTMFAALDQYKKESFYAEHTQIQIEWQSGIETYEVICALTTPVYTRDDFRFYAFSRAASAEEFDSYIAACQARALYDTGKTAVYGDKLLTLSTCEYSQKNGRMLVVAKRIDN